MRVGKTRCWERLVAVVLGALLAVGIGALPAWAASPMGGEYWGVTMPEVDEDETAWLTDDTSHAPAGAPEAEDLAGDGTPLDFPPITMSVGLPHYDSTPTMYALITGMAGFNVSVVGGSASFTGIVESDVLRNLSQPSAYSWTIMPFDGTFTRGKYYYALVNVSIQSADYTFGPTSTLTFNHVVATDITGAGSSSTESDKVRTFAVPLEIAEHSLTRYGRPATCTREGVVPYWRCDVCDVCFADVQGSPGTEALPSTFEPETISALGGDHTWDGEGCCDTCDTYAQVRVLDQGGSVLYGSLEEAVTALDSANQNTSSSIVVLCDINEPDTTCELTSETPRHLSIELNNHTVRIAALNIISQHNAILTVHGGTLTAGNLQVVTPVSSNTASHVQLGVSNATVTTQNLSLLTKIGAAVISLTDNSLLKVAGVGGMGSSPVMPGQTPASSSSGLTFSNFTSSRVGLSIESGSQMVLGLILPYAPDSVVSTWMTAVYGNVAALGEALVPYLPGNAHGLGSSGDGVILGKMVFGQSNSETLVLKPRTPHKLTVEGGTVVQYVLGGSVVGGCPTECIEDTLLLLQPDDPVGCTAFSGTWNVTPSTAKVVEVEGIGSDGTPTVMHTGFMGDADTTFTAVFGESHDWGPWERKVEPTRAKTGLEVRACRRDPSHTEERVVPRANAKWVRLWGQVALDTMQAIAKEYGKAGVAVVTTNAGFKDALAASCLAGRHGALVLTTPKDKVAPQTKAALKAAGVKTVYLVGSTSDVTAATEKALKSGTGVTKVVRISGASPSAKAVAVAKACGKRSDTVIIATQGSFKDALSIAPYSYATKSPILYAETNKSLSAATLKYIKDSKFSKAIIVGGPVALPASIESQLTKSAGIKANNITRLAGGDSYGTSEVIARWATGKYTNGQTVGTYQGKPLATIRFQPGTRLSANRLAVATSQNWKDALCGAALCGKSKSVLLLADSATAKSNWARACGFCSGDDSPSIERAYVLGGTSAVSAKVWDALVASTKL